MSHNDTKLNQKNIKKTQVIDAYTNKNNGLTIAKHNVSNENKIEIAMPNSNSFSDDLAISTNSLNFTQCLKVGNSLIILALLFVTTSVLISFVFDEYFSLAIQVSAHIGTIIFAGVTKVGYVIRCIGAHGLGHKAY